MDKFEQQLMEELETLKLNYVPKEEMIGYLSGPIDIHNEREVYGFNTGVVNAIRLVKLVGERFK